MVGARQLDSSADTETARQVSDRDAPMTQQPSSNAWGGAGIIPFFGKGRPNSEATTAPPSERGFQKLGGRKLESVLVSGGDGYGNPGPSRSKDERNLSNASFYRDSQGTYGGGPPSIDSSMAVGPATRRSAATSSNFELPLQDTVPDRSNASSPLDAISTSPPEIATIRAGPARVPIHTSGFVTPSRAETPPPVRAPAPHALSPVPRLRDAVGRSHPSFDGSRDSRGSRFAEEFD